MPDATGSGATCTRPRRVGAPATSQHINAALGAEKARWSERPRRPDRERRAVNCLGLLAVGMGLIHYAADKPLPIRAGSVAAS